MFCLAWSTNDYLTNCVKKPYSMHGKRQNIPTRSYSDFGNSQIKTGHQDSKSALNIINLIILITLSLF